MEITVHNLTFGNCSGTCVSRIPLVTALFRLSNTSISIFLCPVISSRPHAAQNQLTYLGLNRPGTNVRQQHHVRIIQQSLVYLWLCLVHI